LPWRKAGIKREDVPRGEAWIGAQQADHTAEHETCGHKQHEREGHFSDDENILRDAAPWTSNGATNLQRVMEIGPCGADRRNEAEENPGEDRERERCPEDSAVHRDLRDAWKGGRKDVQ